MDDRRLLIPDRPDNNWLDNYSKFLGNLEVSLMYLIPGVNKTFQINGAAETRNDAHLCGIFYVIHKTP